MSRRIDDSLNWGGKRDKAGRKATGVDKKTVSVSIAKNVLEMAQMTAKAREVSFSALVEEALRTMIEARLNGGKP